MLSLSEGEIGYVAGLIDGEGCISVIKHNNRTQFKSDTFHPYLSISNNNLNLLHWIKEILEGGRIERQYTDLGLSTRYSTTNPSIIENLFMLTLPYLRVKRKHVETMFEYLKVRVRRADLRRKNRDAKGRLIKGVMSPSIIDLKYYEIFHKLNLRRSKKRVDLGDPFRNA